MMRDAHYGTAPRSTMPKKRNTLILSALHACYDILRIMERGIACSSSDSEKCWVGGSRGLQF